MTQDLNRTLYIADNLPILRGINSESIDLIATDPPFNKGVKAFEGIVTAGHDGKGKAVKYSDVWTWGDVQEAWVEQIKENHPRLHAAIQLANTTAGDDMGAFLCWLAVRVLECHRVLKSTGSMYLHIDHTAHVYVKAMMDAIFGRANFRNEIVWAYTGPSAAKSWFPRKHDTILFYVKSPSAPFNGDAVRRPYVAGYTAARGVHGARRGEDSQAKRAVHQRGTIPTDWWADGFLSNVSAYRKELTGYPTQKPLALYERMIKASTSDEKDIVLDPFAGCATTCIAAERLGRKWIGIDINKEARGVTLTRLRAEVKKSMEWRKVVKTRRSPPPANGWGRYSRAGVDAYQSETQSTTLYSEATPRTIDNGRRPQMSRLWMGASSPRLSRGRPSHPQIPRGTRRHSQPRATLRSMQRHQEQQAHARGAARATYRREAHG